MAPDVQRCTIIMVGTVLQKGHCRAIALQVTTPALSHVMPLSLLPRHVMSQCPCWLTQSAFCCLTHHVISQILAGVCTRGLVLTIDAVASYVPAGEKQIACIDGSTKQLRGSPGEEETSFCHGETSRPLPCLATHVGLITFVRLLDLQISYYTVLEPNLELPSGY